MNNPMNDNNENFLLFKFVKTYGVLLVVAFILAVVLAITVAVYIPVDSTLLKISVGLICTWLFYRIFTWLASPLAQFIAYRGNWEKHSEDMNFLASLAKPPSEHPETEPVQKYKTVMMHVENLPESPLGRYMDVDFYEWIDFRDEHGQIQRFKFNGTVDMNALTHMPGVYIVPPGIIYKKDDAMDSSSQ